MSLTSEQLTVIRECAKDETSYQKLLTLIGEIDERGSYSESVSEEGHFFDLSAEDSNLLRNAINTIPVSVYVKDRKSRFVLTNNTNLHQMGLSSVEELYGKTDFEFTKGSEAQPYYEAEQTLMQTGVPIIDFEIHDPASPNGPQWLLTTKAPIRNQNGEIVGLIGINRNITKQKLAEQSLAEERNLLNTIINNIWDKIYIKDRQSRFIMANASTLTAQRSTRETIVGKTDFDFMDAERAQRLYEQEQHIMETGEALVNEEWFVPASLTRDVDRWFLVTKVPVYDERGAISGIVGINREITSRVIAAKQKAELEFERERSRILSDFIADISHEFRTPISIIQTAIYICENSQNAEKQEVYTQRISEQVNRLKELVESLISMSRLDQQDNITVRPVRVSQTIGIMITRLHSEISVKNLHVEQITDDDTLTVEAHEVLLGTAFNNILNNAIRYTPEGGTIEVNTTLRSGKVLIEICDTGIGMSEEVIANIFTRFYREDKMRSTSGFGLGLPMALRIIELHKGSIEVESTVGEGSLFRVILPQYTEG